MRRICDGKATLVVDGQSLHVAEILLATGTVEVTGRCPAQSVIAAVGGPARGLSPGIAHESLFSGDQPPRGRPPVEPEIPRILLSIGGPEPRLSPWLSAPNSGVCPQIDRVLRGIRNILTVRQIVPWHLVFGKPGNCIRVELKLIEAVVCINNRQLRVQSCRCGRW